MGTRGSRLEQGDEGTDALSKASEVPPDDKSCTGAARPVVGKKEIQMPTWFCWILVEPVGCQALPKQTKFALNSTTPQLHQQRTKKK
jgi:hypothetical protein